MSKLSFDLINLILSFRPAHPTSVLIKQLEKDLIKQTENRNRFVRDKIEYNFHHQYFFRINEYRKNCLEKYESEMFCCPFDEGIKILSIKVNKYMNRYFNKKYYFDEKAEIVYYNETQRERELRILDGEMTRRDQEEFDRELSDEYYKEQECYSYYEVISDSDSD